MGADGSLIAGLRVLNIPPSWSRQVFDLQDSCQPDCQSSGSFILTANTWGRSIRYYVYTSRFAYMKWLSRH